MYSYNHLKWLLTYILPPRVITNLYSNTVHMPYFRLTVAVTVEHYILVSIPMKAKLYCTMKNAIIASMSILCFAALLHIFNLVAFRTLTKQCQVI